MTMTLCYSSLQQLMLCVCIFLSFSCFCPIQCTGVEVKFKGAFYDTLISCSQVPELNKMAVTEEGLTVGASVTLTRLEEQLKHLVESLPGKLVGTLIVQPHICDVLLN